MSAPIARSCCRRILSKLQTECANNLSQTSSNSFLRLNCVSKRLLGSSNASGFQQRKGKKLLLGLTGCAVATGVFASAAQYYIKNKAVVHAKDLAREEVKPTRRVQFDTADSGLKVTIFQFITCPFCCKVRAFLDYHGISYDVVEVHSVWKTEIKWSDYKKVPIIVCDGVGKEGFIQLNDSSMIMSLLTSYLFDPTVDLDTFKTYYPALISEGKRGKKIYDYPNRYFIMYQENISDGRTPDERKWLYDFTRSERKWRKWIDEVFVHVISPNVYRTPSEAINTFKWFSEAGDWEQVFSSTSRNVIIYAGSFVMYFVAMMLKRKYELREDVRLSLYDMGNAWMKGLEGRKFQGGDKPNLADLSMYGVLTSIEGTSAFKDLMTNTKMAPWFRRTKEAVQSHMGASDFRGQK